MAAASLIGYALVLIGVSVLSSVVFGGALALGASRLRGLGPWAERRAAALALLLPPLLGLGVALTIAVENLAAFAAGADHCLGHPHHLHLCPIHGTSWIDEPWALAAVAFFSTYLLVRLGRTAQAHLSAQRAATRLGRAGDLVDGFERVVLVKAIERFAFTTGLFAPAVIVSSAAWAALDPAQRDALVTHEQAHIAHGDLWKRAALGLLACFGAPLLAQRAVRRWELASERVCDQAAATAVGRPSVVAGAILALAGSRAQREAPAVAVFAAACDVTERIHSLFDQRASGLPAARRLVVAIFAASAAVALVCALCAGSLHHIIETILG